MTAVVWRDDGTDEVRGAGERPAGLELQSGRMTDIQDLRREYVGAPLDETSAADDPIEQFRRWFDDALAAGIDDPNAMTLATAGTDGMPSARIVLLKGFGAAGFVFYTHYTSRKGRELAADPHAALVFYWSSLHRQVRLRGTVEKVDEAASDAYFARRPLGARLGAVASPQSEVITGRGELEDRLHRATVEHADGAVPRPPTWGGYRLVPLEIEFWQGRENRLHDRLRYRRPAEGADAWVRERLAP